MKIRLRDYGSVLGSRKVAAEIRESLEFPVEFDLEEVLLSHSFADELFGKLGESMGPDKFKENIKIINMEETNKIIIRYVLEDRAK